jgi:hypothetical protein
VFRTARLARTLAAAAVDNALSTGVAEKPS